MSDLGFPGKTRVLVVGFFSSLGVDRRWFWSDFSQARPESGLFGSIRSIENLVENPGFVQFPGVISRADRAGQNPFASVSACEERAPSHTASSKFCVSSISTFHWAGPSCMTPCMAAPRPACHVAPPPCFSMLRLLARAGRPLWAGLALGWLCC